tara:strand:+ start:56 stop:349 length:294 start_codon:yes stop_codon:yes gene_type:complete
MHQPFNDHIMAYLMNNLGRKLAVIETLRRTKQLNPIQYAKSIARLESECNKMEMSEIRYEFECQESLETYHKEPTSEEIIADMNLQLFHLYQRESSL